MTKYLLCENPLKFKKIYSATRLDIDDVKKVRLQSKGIMKAGGKREHLKGRDREVLWHEKADLHQLLKMILIKIRYGN